MVSYYYLLILLVLLQFQIAPARDRRTNKAWVWSSDASRRQLENHLHKASDKLKGAQRFLAGQRMIKYCGRDKPKWRQNCFVDASRQCYWHLLYLLILIILIILIDTLYKLKQTAELKSLWQDELLKLLSCIFWSDLKAQTSPSEE